jgi:hypothetical protein
LRLAHKIPKNLQAQQDRLLVRQLQDLYESFSGLAVGISANGDSVDLTTRSTQAERAPELKHTHKTHGSQRSRRGVMVISAAAPAKRRQYNIGVVEYIVDCRTGLKGKKSGGTGLTISASVPAGFFFEPKKTGFDRPPRI